jgi:hypothetical protein
VKNRRDSQDKGRSARDNTREASVSVCVVGGDGQGRLLTKRHASVAAGADDAFVPTCEALASVTLVVPRVSAGQKVNAYL